MSTDVIRKYRFIRNKTSLWNITKSRTDQIKYAK